MINTALPAAWLGENILEYIYEYHTETTFTA
jgi:hypothetical protein